MTHAVPALPMTVNFNRRMTCLALMLAASGICSVVARAETAELAEDLNEEIIRIPAQINDRTYQLEATLFRPARTGKFPLVVINHGTSKDASANLRRNRFLVPARALVAQGFAVVAPMRRGYGRSQGYAAHAGNDLTSYGLENALDIKAAIQFLREQAFTDASQIFVIGQSTGGLATMAYLSIADGAVLGGLNFHGGVRPHNLFSDPLLDARVTAFQHYAKSTQVRSLWFYTANDHSSTPAFITRLFDAYRQAGGQAELVQLPVFQNDGHYLLNRAEGLPLWLPKASGFISSLHKSDSRRYGGNP